MMEAGGERSVIDDLEQFVREQASLYGRVISYVPASPGQAVDTEGLAPSGEAKLAAANGEATASKEMAPEVNSIGVQHHGYAELEAKLSAHRAESWSSAPTLEVFEQLISDCHKCPLGDTRTKLVFGKGSPTAKAMVIGEAPGADEDMAGEPFVGRAGQLLSKMLEAIQLSRDEVYIANILKSRPPNNRDPRPEEVEACEPYLWKQMLMIQPKIILCLGRIAGSTLLKRTETLGRMREQVFDYHGIKVIVTYHPAALLRNPDWKRGAWEDLKRFKQLYDEL